MLFRVTELPREIPRTENAALKAPGERGVLSISARAFNDEATPVN